MICYDASNGTAYCSEDAKGPGSSRLKDEQLAAIRSLKPIDSKALHRLEKVRDLMLFRHGGTGVAEVQKGCFLLLMLLLVLLRTTAVAV